MNSMVLTTIRKTITKSPYFANILANGDDDVVRTMLESFGIPNASDDDILQTRTLAQSMQSAMSGAGTGPSPVQPLAQDKNTTSVIRNIAMMDPKVMAAVGVAQLASNAIRSFGDYQEDKANRLASAILSGYRDHSDAQDQRFGASRRDKANAAWAQRRMLKGSKAKHITQPIADAADKIIGLFVGNDQAARSIDSAKQIGGQMTGAWADVTNQHRNQMGWS